MTLLVLISRVFGQTDANICAEEHIQLTALRWIDSFFEICPEDMLNFVPRLLNQVLPALSSDIEQVRQAAARVNSSLMGYIMSFDDDDDDDTGSRSEDQQDKQTDPPNPDLSKLTLNGVETRDPTNLSKHPKVFANQDPIIAIATPPRSSSPAPVASKFNDTQAKSMSLDYGAAVNALTLQFLNENEATRVAALSWLIMLQRKAPRKVSWFYRVARVVLTLVVGSRRS